LTRYRSGDAEHVATVQKGGATIDGETIAADVERVAPGTFVLKDGDRRATFHCVRDGAVIHVAWAGVVYRIEEQAEGARGGHKREKTGSLEATMPGKVIAVKAAAGQAVKKGDEIVVVEAMKMENALRAPRDGTVKAVHVKVGDMVGPGAVLAELE
jgi:acetyl/propionyl-CoA carboxylase alpha subunit